MKKIKILDVQFDVVTKDEALARIFECIEKRPYESGKQIVTPNPEMILESIKNNIFRDTINRAFLSIPDGIGVLWASVFQQSAHGNSMFIRYLKATLSLLLLTIYPASARKIFPERITGVDLMESICRVGRSKNLRIFLLGAGPGVAEKTKNILEHRYPGIKIVGTFAGSPQEFDFPAIHASIAETRPDLLFVAYGAPAQELWISEHLKKFKSVKFAMGIGGAFDFISGNKRRAPAWMQKCGMEWLYRLIKEPSRVHRIYNAAIKFPLKIIKGI